MNINTVIIGSGPAGLMAANILQEANIPFIVIEKNPIPGKKLLITGGGRCNVTNALSKREFMDSLTVNKRFLYSALQAFSTPEMIQFFQKQGVELILDKEFKYFPKSNKSIDIVKALTNNIEPNIYTNETVQTIEKKDTFLIKTDQRMIHASNVIIATGSKSYPKTGSTGFGVKVAKDFGLNTIDFYPAETSLYSTYIKQHKDQLQGISFSNVTVSIKGTKHKTKGDLLFTHFGLSGPAIQHISESVFHNLASNNIVTFSVTNHSESEIRSLFEEASSNGKTVLRILEQLTIKRFARFLLDTNHIQNTKLKETSKKTINKLIQLLTQYEVKIDRVEHIENAYVNGGGVDTLELNPKSFESKKVSGLFFIGETVDVHGPIGGFNITIASSMGYAAAQKIIKNALK